MPTPRNSHAAIIVPIDPDAPNSASPMASTMFDAHSTGRPPTWSMCRPIHGPRSPEITSEAENAAKNQLLDMPRSRAMGSARMAGR